METTKLDPKANSADFSRYRRNWQNEMDAAALYREMAKTERQKPLAEIYRRLALVEDKHAAFWAERISTGGGKLDVWNPSLRSRLLAWMSRRFGAQTVLPLVSAAEASDQTVYDDQPESAKTEMPRDERSHARILKVMEQSSPQGMDGSSLARLEGRHRAIGGNALRAAVLGANDGLLSNLSLVMGVAGAEMSNRSVLVSGIAGLLAGAFSMAIGEWISVQSSRELNQFQITAEADELASAPDEEEEELGLIYEAKGLSPEEAKALAKRLIADPKKALDTLTREELGIDPKDLGGSPWEAAGASFFLFALGALIPVVPFLFFKGSAAIPLAMAVSGLGLFSIGAAITLVTGRSLWISGARQLLFGLAAACVTFGIGHLIGTHLIG